MPDIQTTVDRVVMKLADKVIWQSDTRENLIAALSSHGLRELLEASQLLIDGSMLVASGTTYVPRGRFERFEKALALLGD